MNTKVKGFIAKILLIIMLLNTSTVFANTTETNQDKGTKTVNLTYKIFYKVMHEVKYIDSEGKEQKKSVPLGDYINKSKTTPLNITYPDITGTAAGIEIPTNLAIYDNTIESPQDLDTFLKENKNKSFYLNLKELKEATKGRLFKFEKYEDNKLHFGYEVEEMKTFLEDVSFNGSKKYTIDINSATGLHRNPEYIDIKEYIDPDSKYEDNLPKDSEFNFVYYDGNTTDNKLQKEKIYTINPTSGDKINWDELKCIIEKSDIENSKDGKYQFRLVGYTYDSKGEDGNISEKEVYISEAEYELINLIGINKFVYLRENQYENIEYKYENNTIKITKDDDIKEYYKDGKYKIDENGEYLLENNEKISIKNSAILLDIQKSDEGSRFIYDLLRGFYYEEDYKENIDENSTTKLTEEKKELDEKLKEIEKEDSPFNTLTKEILNFDISKKSTQKQVMQTFSFRSMPNLAVENEICKYTDFKDLNYKYRKDIIDKFYKELQEDGKYNTILDYDEIPTKGLEKQRYDYIAEKSEKFSSLFEELGIFFRELDGDNSEDIENNINGKIETSKEEIKTLKDEIEGLNNEITISNKNIKELKEKIETLEENIATLKEKIKTLNDEIEELNEKINDENISKEDKEKITKEIEELNSKVERLNSEIESNNESIKENKNTTKELNSQITKNQENIKTKEEEIKESEDELNKLENSIEYLNKLLSQLENEMKYIRDFYYQVLYEDLRINHIDTYYGRYLNLNDLLIMSQDKIKADKTSLNTYLLNNHKLIVDEKFDKISDFTEVSKEDLEGYKVALDEFKTENTVENKKEENKLKSIENIVNKSVFNNLYKESDQAKIDELNLGLNKKNKELTEKKQALNTSKKDKNDKDLRIAEILEEISKINEELENETDENQIKELNEKLEKLNEEKITLNTAINELESKITSLNEEIAKINEEIKNINENLNNLKEQTYRNLINGYIKTIRSSENNEKVKKAITDLNNEIKSIVDFFKGNIDALISDYHFDNMQTLKTNETNLKGEEEKVKEINTLYSSDALTNLENDSERLKDANKFNLLYIKRDNTKEDLDPNVDLSEDDSNRYKFPWTKVLNDSSNTETEENSKDDFLEYTVKHTSGFYKDNFENIGLLDMFKGSITWNGEIDERTNSEYEGMATLRANRNSKLLISDELLLKELENKLHFGNKNGKMPMKVSQIVLKTNSESGGKTYTIFRNQLVDDINIDYGEDTGFIIDENKDLIIDLEKIQDIDLVFEDEFNEEYYIYYVNENNENILEPVQIKRLKDSEIAVKGPSIIKKEEQKYKLIDPNSVKVNEKGQKVIFKYKSYSGDEEVSKYIPGYDSDGNKIQEDYNNNKDLNNNQSNLGDTDKNSPFRKIEIIEGKYTTCDRKDNCPSNPKHPTREDYTESLKSTAYTSVDENNKFTINIDDYIERIKKFSNYYSKDYQYFDIVAKDSSGKEVKSKLNIIKDKNNIVDIEKELGRNISDLNNIRIRVLHEDWYSHYITEEKNTFTVTHTYTNGIDTKSSTTNFSDYPSSSNITFYPMNNVYSYWDSQFKDYLEKKDLLSFEMKVNNSTKTNLNENSATGLPSGSSFNNIYELAKKNDWEPLKGKVLPGKDKGSLEFIYTFTEDTPLPEFPDIDLIRYIVEHIDSRSGDIILKPDKLNEYRSVYRGLVDSKLYLKDTHDYNTKIQNDTKLKYYETKPYEESIILNRVTEKNTVQHMYYNTGSQNLFTFHSKVMIPEKDGDEYKTIGDFKDSKYNVGTSEYLDTRDIRNLVVNKNIDDDDAEKSYIKESIDNINSLIDVDENYIFIGWSEEEPTENNIENIRKVLSDGDFLDKAEENTKKDFYAIYAPKNLKFLFDANNGIFKENVSGELNDTFTELTRNIPKDIEDINAYIPNNSDLSKLNHHLNGWYKCSQVDVNSIINEISGESLQDKDINLIIDALQENNLNINIVEEKNTPIDNEEKDLNIPIDNEETKTPSIISITSENEDNIVRDFSTIIINIKGNKNNISSKIEKLSPKALTNEEFLKIVKDNQDFSFNDEEIRFCAIWELDKKEPEEKPDSGGNKRPSKPKKEEEIIRPQIESTLLHKGYINGYPDNTIRPVNNLTREEASAILDRVTADKSMTKRLFNYPDVEKNRWSYNNIENLSNKGGIKGYPDGNFKPVNKITRAEAATILVRLENAKSNNKNIPEEIKDHWAKEEMTIAIEKGWIKGYEDGSIKADKEITRAEFVALVNRMLGRKVSYDKIEEKLIPSIESYKDLDKSAWYYEDIIEAANTHNYKEKRLDDGSEKWTQIIK